MRFTHFSSFFSKREDLFHRHAFREVSRFINGPTKLQSGVIGEQLTRHNRQEWIEDVYCFWYYYRRIRTVSYREYESFPCFNFMYCGSCFIIKCIGGIEDNAWKFLADESQRSMFELSCRICFRVNIGDFFEFYRTLASNRCLVVSTQEKTMIVR
jgi:hypothetical protein